jgi:hypothetical protein
MSLPLSVQADFRKQRSTTNIITKGTLNTKPSSPTPQKGKKMDKKVKKKKKKKNPCTLLSRVKF